jgi:carboxymethylenebutenolidase
MCYEPSARPPAPPIAGGAGPGRPLSLTATDGNRFSAFTALRAGGLGGPGVVVLPDVRGLHGFYTDLAVRFAEAGVHATVIDYFGRSAGIGERGDDFDNAPHVAATQPDTVALDVAAAVGHVRSPEGGGSGSVFTVGFCFGGRHSFNQAARGHGLSGAIGFYGRVAPNDEADTNAPLDLAALYGCPVLGLFGGDDRAILPADIDAFGDALNVAAVPHHLVVYDGAPHSFFDRSYDRYQEDCQDAWTRVLEFIHHHT